MSAAVAGPLQGRRIVVTRDEPADGPLASHLRSEGAEVLLWKTTMTGPPEEPDELRAAVSDLERYDWILFTSARAVEAVAGVAIDPPSGPKIAAVGTATARALKSVGWRVDLIPGSHGAEHVISAMAESSDLKDAAILYPASEIARSTVEERLAALGARVSRTTAYRTVPLPLDVTEIEGDLAEGPVDAVTFTSPSAVESLVNGLGAERFADLMSATTVVAIGPTTADALLNAGVTDPREPEQSTLQALAGRLIELLEE